MKHAILSITLMALMSVSVESQNFVSSYDAEPTVNVSEFVGSSLDAFGNAYLHGSYKSVKIDGVTTTAPSSETHYFITKKMADGSKGYFKDVFKANSWSRLIQAIVPDKLGNLYVAIQNGSIVNKDTVKSTAANEAAFLQKYDAQGKLLWTKGVTPSSLKIDKCSMAVAPDGGVFIIATSPWFYDGITIEGKTLSQVSKVFMKLDKDGKLVFLKGLAIEDVLSMTVNSKGELVVFLKHISPSNAAYRFADLGDGVKIMFPDVPANATEYFLAAFDGTGKALWGKPFNTTWADANGQATAPSFTALTCDANDNLYVHGEYYGGLRFNNTILNVPNNLIQKPFLAGFNPDGTYRFAKTILIDYYNSGSRFKGFEVSADNKYYMFLTHPQKAFMIVDNQMPKSSVYNSADRIVVCLNKDFKLEWYKYIQQGETNNTATPTLKLNPTGNLMVLCGGTPKLGQLKVLYPDYPADYWFVEDVDAVGKIIGYPYLLELGAGSTAVKNNNATGNLVCRMVAKDNLYVSINESTKYNLSIFDLNGRMVASQNNCTGAINIPVNANFGSMFLVNVVTDSGERITAKVANLY